MDRAIRLGMLTPSSNTVLEPMTNAMISGLPEVSAHYSRFKVTEISLSERALSQFDNDAIMKAAELLAHAKVDVIAWNGTSAAWRGFDTDEQLCEQILSVTGIPACTSMLAYRELFELHAIRRIGLVTPYRDDVQAKIVSNFSQAGYICVAERHLNLQDNFSFALIEPRSVADMARAVAPVRCDAIAILCTNMRGADLAEPLESELNIPIYDSISTAILKSLSIAGVDTDRVRGWGSLFKKALAG